MERVTYYDPILNAGCAYCLGKKWRECRFPHRKRVGNDCVIGSVGRTNEMREAILMSRSTLEAFQVFVPKAEDPLSDIVPAGLPSLHGIPVLILEDDEFSLLPDMENKVLKGDIKGIQWIYDLVVTLRKEYITKEQFSRMAEKFIKGRKEDESDPSGGGTGNEAETSD